MKIKLYFLLVFLFVSGGFLTLNAQTFTGDNLGGVITDTAPLDSQANVTTNGTVGVDFVIDNVTVDITHSWDGDVTFTLISPAGTNLILSDGNGGSGDDYTNTVFQDGGADITAGTPPFTGVFEPQGGTFATTFDGESINGTWTLNIVDSVGADDGVLNNFEITFSPVNDDLCNATPLIVDATSAGDAFSNLGASEETGEPIPGCFNGGINGSVWFSFVAPASGFVQVTTDISGGTLTDTEIAVYEAPTDCNDLTTLGPELGCDQDGGTTVGFNSIVDVTGLTPGDTYFVQVDQWGTVSPGTFGIEVNIPPPSNDDACDAIALTVDATSPGDAYNNFGATEEVGEPVPGCFNSGIDGSVWFTFVAPPSGSVEVTTDIAGASLVDTEIAVFEEPTDCSDLTTFGPDLACDQDGGTTIGFNSIINVAGLTPGDTYYVQVDQWGTVSPGTFGIEVNESSASVQVIHNSADPSAEFVDVYLNGVLTLDDFEFRTATSFLDVPAGVPIDVDVAPSTSTDVSESIFNLNTTLVDGESYIVVADGVLDPALFDATVNTIDFNLEVFAGAQQVSTNAGETSVLVHHGSTDAPTVDVREISVPAGIIVDDISYPEFQGYLDLANQDYELSVELGDNSAVVASYQAPLATLGLADQAISVLASGFLDPAANQNGAAFGLWAALPAGGPLVELPEFTPPPANDDVCDAIALTVDATSAGDAYTNVGATAQTDEPVPGCFAGGVDQSVWFTFVAPASGAVEVTTDIAGGTFTDTEIALFEAPTDCADLTTFGPDLACDQDGGTTVAFNSIINVTGLTPGDTYYVQVDRWNTATPGTFGIEVIDQTVGTESFSDENFSFYPNPAQNLLNLQTAGQVQEVKVYNMLGQQVMRETPNTVSPSLNVEALQTGSYIMNVTIDGSSENFRFIKE